MHGQAVSSSAAFVAPRGLINPALPSWNVSKDGRRISPQPLGMFTGLEGEAFNLVKDVLTAGATGATGDIIAQLAEKKKGDMEGEGEGSIVFFEEPFELDARRSIAYGSFAAGYTGAFQHFLFSNLQETIPDPIVRVVINQGLIIPLCYYTLLVWLVPKLRARSNGEEDELRGSINVKKMIPRNWAFWVPLQFIQFNFIPMEFQVIYCSFLGLIWNICLSLLTAGSGSKTDAEPVPLPETAMMKSSGVIANVKISISETEGATPKAAGLTRAMRSANAPSYAGKTARERTGSRWLRILNGSVDSKTTPSSEATAAEEKTEALQPEDFLDTVFGRRR